jgi:hypothetical protein
MSGQDVAFQYNLSGGGACKKSGFTFLTFLCIITV